MAELSENTKGALLTVAATVGFTLNDAFMKALSDELSLSQALFLRGLAVTFLLAAVGQAVGALRWPPDRTDRHMLLLRGLADTVATYFFLSAVFNMPLANANAILQALPLTVTLGAALFFSEPLGWRRLTAIGIGFLGVLLIVRPGMEGFNVYGVYALVAVILITVRDLSARKMSPRVSSLLAASVTSGMVTLAFGAAAIFGQWNPVSPLAAAQLSGAVVSIFVGYFFAVAAVRVGEIGAVAPFRYSALVVALLVGVMAFDEWPGPLALLGAAVVVASGMFTLMREAALRRQKQG